MRHLRNIFNLGIKELRSLLGDKAMLTLIVFSFTVSVYSSATVTPGSLNLAPIAIADMDQSQLSNRIVNSFYRPWFLPPEMITADEMDAGLDAGRYTFAINIPPNFQRDVFFLHLQICPCPLPCYFVIICSTEKPIPIVIMRSFLLVRSCCVQSSNPPSPISITFSPTTIFAFIRKP